MDVPPAPTQLRIERLGPEHSMDFGSMMAWNFEPSENPQLATWFAAVVSMSGFATYGAWDGTELVAVAASHTANCRTILCGAAAIPQARGRGVQRALISARLADAEAEHSVWVSAETGAETPGSPNPSLRNLNRMGLVPLYERRNFLWSAND